MMAASKLIKAIQSGKLPVVRAALAAGEKVNEPRSDPPLRQAASKGNVGMVKALLAAGADPKQRNGRGEDALFYARTPQVAKLLLAAGADPNVLTKWGTTPLHLAAANGSTAIAKVLLAHGAKTELRNERGETPLLLAARHGKTDLVKVLLAAGAKVDATDPGGDTALKKIAGRGASVKIATLLRKAGANIDHVGTHHTALGAAAYHRDWPLVQWLLKAGAQADLPDKFGCTPLLCAVLMEDAKIAQALLKAGAKWSQRISKKHGNRNLAGKTIAEVAAQTSKRFQNQVLRPSAAAR